jgi:hypothetical protein
MAAADVAARPADASGPAASGPAASVTVAGQQVAVPVEVRSAKMVGGTFTVPATAAQRLIDYSGLTVQRIAGTLGICMLSGVQYTDNDLGPYNEIALAIVVQPPDTGADDGRGEVGGGGSGRGGGGLASGDVTTLIHRLPVNQEFTCAAGRDIWGFPKWVADIEYRQRPRRTDVTMIDEGEHAVTLSVEHRFAVPLPGREMAMTCYAWREGVLRRTSWTMRMAQMRMRPGGVSVAVGERTLLAEDLRALGFPKSGLMSQSVGHLACTFGPAEIIR